MKIVILITNLMLISLLIAGCETANTNGNINANRAAAAKNDNANISRGDFEKQKERFEREAKELGRKIGDGADDLWIWTKTRSALAYTDDLRDSTINVDVDNNVVTLSGTLPDEAQKTKAEQIARSIEGVTTVKNDIVISSAEANRNKNAR